MALFAGSLLSLSSYVYYWSLGASPSVTALAVAVGFALSGVAESLPKRRRRVAGVFRVALLTLLFGLLATTIFSPEVI
ncbi:hypothetical protein [Halogranum gelatinilyticum]|uniref:hypothetical protein n=1 Tax=Halogranum gelatinilyticum TaxID=660521 RepID=UPI001FCDC5BE|nr:hypothetical protein [Halogranum gelatinilyticum]